MGGRKAFEHVTLTIEADVLRRARARVERGELSAYVNLALQRQLEHLIGELSEVNGPLDPDAVSQHVVEWR